jgi:hypothetical protein
VHDAQLNWQLGVERDRASWIAASIIAANELSEAGKALRRSQPSISLAWITKQMPFKRDAERGRYLEALRRAGLR